jgi:hypothetical protein
MSDPTEQTFVKRIIIGTPVRKVTGAQAQGIADLIDVDTSGLKDGDVLEFSFVDGKFKVSTEPRNLTISGGTF